MGKVRITFYGALAKITREKTVEVNGSTLKAIINTLTEKYGEQFSNKIYDKRGKLRRFVNIYVNGKDVRFLGHLNTELNDGDEVSIIPAVGGG